MVNSNASPRRILFISGPGGHFSEVKVLLNLFEESEKLLVSYARRDTLNFNTEIKKKYIEAPYRRPHRVLRNFYQAHKIIRGFRPDLIITTGAGIALGACYLGKAYGAIIVHIECSAQTKKPSLFGKLISPIVDLRFVQWKAALHFYRNAKLARLLFVNSQQPRFPKNEESRVRVFVTLGTTIERFDRLIDAIDIVSSQMRETHSFYVQHGSSSSPMFCDKSYAYLDINQFEEQVHSADVIITHSGVGCIASALTKNKKPLIVPRLKKYKEHANDHQLEIAHQLMEDFDLDCFGIDDGNPILSDWLYNKVASADNCNTQEYAMNRLPSLAHELSIIQTAIQNKLLEKKK